MDTKAVIQLVDELQDNLEDLEENLEPLLHGDLAATTKKLPLLDRAKLHVLLVYSIESLIFSYLKLHGVQAKEHPVFKELTRVKQYFEKIKQSEETPQTSRPTLALDKDAAGRFIKHALAGNDKYDLQRAEREARERVLANKKLKALESAMKAKAEVNANPDSPSDVAAGLVKVARMATDMLTVEDSSEEGLVSDSEGDDDITDPTEQPQPQPQEGKKRKRGSGGNARRIKEKRDKTVDQIPGGNKLSKKDRKKLKRSQILHPASTAG
ncbi:hypothetical protein AYL99_07202 [Fonsecaea erecta]|uniref:Exosome complex protein n=1 Tax=Fonsecaea erecta TaxID=1367422 RepID=A0A178ZEP9_9EURO|nr:hypothetical protein AYL99_07202 [Fonsecaea erecta]OAP58112.1 hypothetical protein AYL99_07202 [Fonsecaea erecta]